MVKKKTSDKSQVSRSEIESKLKELDEIVEEATNSAEDVVKIAIGIGIVILIFVAFLSGRRRALRKRTIISFVKTK